MASLEFFDGTNWIVIGGNSTGGINLAGDIIGNGVTNGITQTTFNVTNFDLQVRTNRLDQMALPNTSLNLNSQTIVNLKSPESGDSAVNCKFMFDLLQDETVLVW